MIKIIDTLSQIDSLFDNGNFIIEKWENYINSTYARSAGVFKKDLKEYLESGNYVYKKDILPIINSVYNNTSLQILQVLFL